MYFSSFLAQAAPGCSATNASSSCLRFSYFSSGVGSGGGSPSLALTSASSSLIAPSYTNARGAYFVSKHWLRTMRANAFTWSSYSPYVMSRAMSS